MAVTLIRKRAGGGPQKTSRRCPECTTRYAVEFEPAERLTIDVTGPTCKACNPHLRGRGDGPPQVVKIWWDSGPDVVPELRVQRVTGTHRVSEPIAVPSPRVSGRPVAAAVDEDGELRARARAMIDEKLGEQTGAVLYEGWRGSTCEALVAPALALEQVATMDDCDPSGGLRITYRLSGATALAVALTTEAVGRVVAAGWAPLKQIPYTLRAVAVVLCTAIAILDECRTAELIEHAVDQIANRADLARLIDAVATRFAVPADLPQITATIALAVESVADLNEDMSLLETGTDTPLEVLDQLARDLGLPAPHGPYVFGRREP